MSGSAAGTGLTRGFRSSSHAAQAAEGRTGTECLTRPLLVTVLGVLALLALPSPSAASHDPSGAPFDEDVATGRIVFPETCTPSACFYIVFVFEARSGPS